MPEDFGRNGSSETPLEKLQEEWEAVRQKAEGKTERELARQPSRRAFYFQLYVLVSVIAFAALTYLAALSPYTALDLSITRALQSLKAPFFAWLMEIVSWPGFMPQGILVILIPALIVYYLGFRREAGMTVLVGLFANLLSLAIKAAVERPRPDAGLVDVAAVLNNYSFPSGHVLFYTSFFGFWFFLCFTFLRHSWKRSLLLLLLAGLILLVGPSRIYLGQHWASDVLGAYLLGSLSLSGAILLYRRLNTARAD